MLPSTYCAIVNLSSLITPATSIMVLVGFTSSQFVSNDNAPESIAQNIVMNAMHTTPATLFNADMRPCKVSLMVFYVASEAKLNPDTAYANADFPTVLSILLASAS